MRRGRAGVVFAIAGVAIGLGLSALAEPPAPAPPVVQRPAALAAHPIAQGKGTATVYYHAAAGSPEAAMTLLALEPGAAVPPHVHATSVELLYVIEGSAEMKVGAETMMLQAGDAARIPMGVEHAAKVIGARAFRAIQIYTPAGPEQRFIPK